MPKPQTEAEYLAGLVPPSVAAGVGRSLGRGVLRTVADPYAAVELWQGGKDTDG